MRLHLTLTPNTETVPFNYQYKIIRIVHGWLGNNDYHDETSMYSFSWIRGKTQSLGEGLEFTGGGHWFISFWDEKPIQQLKEAIISKPYFLNGMKVQHIKEQRTPEFKDQYRFKVASPVLVRKTRDNKSRDHLSFEDEMVNEILTQRMRSKMKKAGLGDLHLDTQIKFDETYKHPKTKLIDIKGTKLLANLCPVIIKGTPTAIKFAWDVGVGELTGSGFGALA